MERISHMDMTKPAIEMREIVKKFGDFTANDHVNLLVHKGEVHAILGENGAGKSTLMNVLYGLYQPTSGQIFVGGKEEVIHSPSRAIELGIGMVHQHFKLVECFSVLDNIMLGVETTTKGGFLKKDEARKKVVELSEKYGLAVDPDAKIENITVGMQQRTEILKMLYRDNEVLIFDEPTRGIDVGAKNEIYKLMSKLAAEGKSIIMISSEMTEILRMSDRIIVMCEGEVTGNIDISEATQEHIMDKATRNIN